MWTVFVEVHLPNGKGTLFNIGEWHHSAGAASFARKLESVLGEDKATAGVAYMGNIAWRLAEKISKGKVSVKQGIVLPPCDMVDFDDY